MNKKAVKVTTTGEISTLDYEDDFALEAFQDAVNGYIEAISLPKLGLKMFVNENGKIQKQEANPTAQAMWNFEYGQTDRIVGNIVVTPIWTTGDGEILSFTDDQVEHLSGLLNQLAQASATPTE